MSFGLMLAVIFIVIPGLLIIWLIRLMKLWRKGTSARKSFYVEVLILTVLIGFISWNLGLFPLSRNLYVKEISEQITGKSFWSAKVHSFDEISIRGEGYSLDVFKFNEEMAEYFKNPDKDFFENYPKELKYREDWKRVKWKKTPVVESEYEYLSDATPHYGNWRQAKIKQVDFVKYLANKKGGFYAFNTSNGDVDFFIISPEDRLIVIINHNQ